MCHHLGPVSLRSKVKNNIYYIEYCNNNNYERTARDKKSQNHLSRMSSHLFCQTWLHWLNCLISNQLIITYEWKLANKNGRLKFIDVAFIKKKEHSLIKMAKVMWSRGCFRTGRRSPREERFAMGISRSWICMAILYWTAVTVRCCGVVVSTLTHYDGDPGSIAAVELFFCFVVFFFLSLLFLSLFIYFLFYFLTRALLHSP